MGADFTISQPEARKLAGVSRYTLHRYRRDGLLAFFRDPQTGTIFYRLDDVRRIQKRKMRKLNQTAVAGTN